LDFGAGNNALVEFDVSAQPPKAILPVLAPKYSLGNSIIFSASFSEQRWHAGGVMI